jgi:predicted transcriptional regulator
MEDKAVYTVAEIAEMTGFSRSTITRMFEAEKGVVILQRPEKVHKRSYRSIRIPRTVFARVVGRLTIS